MNGPTAAADAPARVLRAARRPARGGTALVGGVAVATVAAVLAGLGPAVAVVPAFLAAGAWAVVRAPLRWSGAVLLFLLLAVDDHMENVGQWRTPLAFVGDLLHYRLDDVAHVPGLAVTGMEVIVVVLLAVWARRRAAGETLDVRGHVGVARVMRGFVLLCLAGVIFADANGLLHGQALVPWKVRNLLHPVMLFLFFDLAFRGPADHALVGRIVVGAGVVRALEAIVVQRISIAETGGKFAVGTSHGDSVLFAAATYLVLVDALERPTWRRVGRAALILPVLLGGMLQNERRIVWVMLLMMLAVTYLVTPMRGWKRTLTRTLAAVLPVVVLYVAVGWNAQSSRIFAPIRTIRSVTDTSVDHSAYWREVENWNISMTMRAHPLFGMGLGGRYVEHMYNDDISSLYKEYREWPHNTVLGQLFLLGAVPFVAVWALFGAGLFLALRAFRFARSADDRVAALGCAGTIVACHVLAYGDTGAHYSQYKILMALALAFAGKLAVTTGAWPSAGAGAPAGDPLEGAAPTGGRDRVTAPDM